ncbi:MAG: hypothetical protein FWH29_00270 [Methanobrevibacter sp.]|nr:hypothetical protein [Methanobrevibacter sp.]
MKKSMKLAIIMVMMLYMLPTCFADVVDIDPLESVPEEINNMETVIIVGMGVLIIATVSIILIITMSKK